MNRALVEAAQSGSKEAFASIARGSADRLFAGRAQDPARCRASRVCTAADPGGSMTLSSSFQLSATLNALRGADAAGSWCTPAVRGSEARLDLVVQRGDPDDRGPDAELHPERSATLPDALEPAFQHLPPEQLTVSVLPGCLGWPLGEIAESLDVPVGTLKSRLHYATSTLRAALEAATPTPAACLGSAWHDGQRFRTTDSTSLARGRPEPVPDRVLQSALEEVHLTRQRRAWWQARRNRTHGLPHPCHGRGRRRRRRRSGRGQPASQQRWCSQGNSATLAPNTYPTPTPRALTVIDHAVPIGARTYCHRGSIPCAVHRHGALRLNGQRRWAVRRVAGSCRWPGRRLIRL